MIFRRAQFGLGLLLSALAGIWLYAFLWQVKSMHNLDHTDHEDHPQQKMLSFSKKRVRNWKQVKDPFYDKEKIIAMLKEMETDPEALRKETWARVPTWNEVVELWGPEPIIHGLEHCATFRQQIQDARNRRIAVAGLWSTGTNVLAQLLQHNCAIPERVEWLGRKRGHGMEWQVPWGKHSPFYFRGNHSTKDFLTDKYNPKLEDYLPVVTVREPFSWMVSMCRHPYTLKWDHTQHNCPNLINKQTKKASNASAGFFGGYGDSYESIPHLWNEWNGEYYYTDQQKPVIMVRFEDLIFYPKEVTQKVCECAGGKVMKPHHVYGDHDTSIGGNFFYVVWDAKEGKNHGGDDPKHGLLEAWIKYSIPKNLLKIKKADREFAKGVLDQTMLKTFGYT